MSKFLHNAEDVAKTIPRPRVFSETAELKTGGNRKFLSTMMLTITLTIHSFFENSKAID